MFLLKSVVELIYTGDCTLTPVCDVKAIMDLMKSMGLFIQADMLQVVDFEEHLMNKIPVIVPGVILICVVKICMPARC